MSVGGLGRVAVVHDYLSQYGGAERVALVLAEMFNAPLYTSLYQPNQTYDEFKSRDVRTSALQKLVPEGRFRLAAPLFAAAFRSFDLSDFDTVVISSSGFAHHVQHPNAFVYCHTPPRFLYDLGSYFARPWQARLAGAAVPLLRRSDQRAAARHAHYVANSILTSERIETVYGKATAVIHPPLRTDHLPPVPPPLPSRTRALVVARLQPYKRVDVAIAACTRAGIPLTIVGTGIDEQRLQSLAAGDVTFAGRVPDDELPGLYAEHSVVLAPGVEDFGLATLEANYAGRPVVARAAGGALETMSRGVTGELVAGDDNEAWAEALRRVADAAWEPEELRAATLAFQRPAFVAAVEAWVSDPHSTELPGGPVGRPD